LDPAGRLIQPRIIEACLTLLPIAGGSHSLLFQGFFDRHGILESERSGGVDQHNTQIKYDFPASFAQNPLKTGVKRKKTQKTPRKPV
jgi:hypothetical protein